MNILTPGHRYELDNHENPLNVPKQILQFIEKKPAGESFPPGSLITVNEGTTNEEVIRVLVDRLSSMQAKFPCRENAIATTHLETALLWLEKRTASRKAQGVEGKHLAHDSAPVPKAPAVDNANVAEGCEKFAEPAASPVSRTSVAGRQPGLPADEQPPLPSGGLPAEATETVYTTAPAPAPGNV